MNTFISRVLAGQATVDDIDTYVDMWHDDVADQRELHEALGLLWPEYAMWVEDHQTLKYVVEARRRNQPLPHVLRQFVGDDTTSRRIWEIAGRYADEWRGVGCDISS